MPLAVLSCIIFRLYFVILIFGLNLFMIFALSTKVWSDFWAFSFSFCGILTCWYFANVKTTFME